MCQDLNGRRPGDELPVVLSYGVLAGCFSCGMGSELMYKDVNPLSCMGRAEKQSRSRLEGATLRALIRVRAAELGQG